MVRIRGCYIPRDRREHFARKATPEEVHEVLENHEWPALWLRTRSYGTSPAYIVLGRTATGRYLVIPGIVLAEPPLKDVFMPVTVRDMTDAERRLYHRHRPKGVT